MAALSVPWREILDVTSPLSAADSPAFDKLLDASGLFCPEPVMLLHNAVRDIAIGAVLKVVATDPSTRRDIPKFCRFLGHELLAQQERDGQFLYFIRKGA